MIEISDGNGEPLYWYDIPQPPTATVEPGVAGKAGTAFESENRDVVLRVGLPEKFGVHEFVVIEVVLENRSERTVRHWILDPPLDLAPDLVDPAGEPVALTEFGRLYLREKLHQTGLRPRWITQRRRYNYLAPGHQYTWRLNLSRTYALTPGTFQLSLRAHYRHEGEEEIQILEIHGIPIRVEAADMNRRDRYIAANWDIDTARREYVRDLRERHGDPGERADHIRMPASHEYALRANRIFREWNPVGFSSDDLRKVLGEPHREVEALHRHFPVLWEYDFIVGPAGAHWRFGVDANDRIVAIEFIPGE